MCFEKCRAISKVNKVIFCQAEKTKEMPVIETVPENKIIVTFNNKALLEGRGLQKSQSYSGKLN